MTVLMVFDSYTPNRIILLALTLSPKAAAEFCFTNEDDKNYDYGVSKAYSGPCE